MNKKLILLIILVFSVSFSVYSQGNKFSIAGGPVIGYYYNNTSDLNAELIKMGIPKMSESGFLTVGGGGFIDFPFIPGLRVGAFGTGFTQSSSVNTVNNITKTAKYNLQYGAISVEYVQRITKKFDVTYGGTVGIGSLNLDVSKYSNTLQNWNGGIAGNDTLYNNSNDYLYSVKNYSVEPRIGAGFQLMDYLYLKLNVGYNFGIQSKWKLNDVLEIQNFPSGIKANGLDINFSINAGIFL